MEPKINGLKPVWDEQIKTPKHDEMCLYLIDPKNIMKIIEKESQYNLSSQLDESQSQFEFTYLNKKETHELSNKFTKTAIKRLEGEEKKLIGSEYLIDGFWKKEIITNEIIKIEWELIPQTILERPVKSRSFLVGVIDAEINVYGYPILTIKKTTETIIYKPQKEKSWSENITPYLSINQPIDNKETREEIITEKQIKKLLCRFFVEVKPSILSLGETLRQLNTYQSYLTEDSGMRPTTYEKNNFLVFTTKKDTKQLFHSQGYSFISLEELEPVQKQLTDGEFQ